jgi:hypothetical protein
MTTHKAVRVKLKMQWRPQDVGFARNVESLPKRAASNE